MKCTQSLRECCTHKPILVGVQRPHSKRPLHIAPLMLKQALVTYIHIERSRWIQRTRCKRKREFGVARRVVVGGKRWNIDVEALLQVRPCRDVVCPSVAPMRAHTVCQALYPGPNRSCIRFWIVLAGRVRRGLRHGRFSAYPDLDKALHIESVLVKGECCRWETRPRQLRVGDGDKTRIEVRREAFDVGFWNADRDGDAAVHHEWDRDTRLCLHGRKAMRDVYFLPRHRPCVGKVRVSV